jgi:hypothetical protein
VREKGIPYEEESDDEDEGESADPSKYNPALLQARIDRRNRIAAGDADEETPDSELVPHLEDSELDKLSDLVLAKFNRSRTHNEQLFLAPCGMLTGRETMYGAEATSAVAVSFALFAHYSRLTQIENRRQQSEFTRAGYGRT